MLDYREHDDINDERLRRRLVKIITRHDDPGFDLGRAERIVTHDLFNEFTTLSIDIKLSL